MFNNLYKIPNDTIKWTIIKGMDYNIEILQEILMYAKFSKLFGGLRKCAYKKYLWTLS